MIKLFEKLLFAGLLCFIFGTIAISAQKNTSEQVAIKTQNGFLFINNNPEKSFSIEINGKEVKQAKGVDVPMFIVDDKLVQILSVPLTNFVPKGKKLTEKEILNAYKIWESDYLGDEMYGEKLKVESEDVVGEHTALFWGFKRPSQNQQFERDYFLTTIIGKYLMALGSPTASLTSEEEAKKFLIETLKTLKVSDKPFDIVKMSNEIRNDSSEGK